MLCQDMNLMTDYQTHIPTNAFSRIFLNFPETCTDCACFVWQGLKWPPHICIYVQSQTKKHDGGCTTNKKQHWWSKNASSLAYHNIKGWQPNQWRADDACLLPKSPLLFISQTPQLQPQKYIPSSFTVTLRHTTIYSRHIYVQYIKNHSGKINNF